MSLLADVTAAWVVGPGIWAGLGPGSETAYLAGALEADWGADWAPDPDWQPKPACLPPRAARRLSPEIRLALATAERLSPALDPDAGWVFASSNGEGQTLDVILTALMSADMLVQPTRFQNAVHNAASGQWTIADGRTGPATSIAAFDETAGAGLLKALMQVALEGRAVGLVCYDVPLPPPLHEKRPMGTPLSVGVALRSPGDAKALARLTAATGQDTAAAPSNPRSPAGTALLNAGNPAAALLPLLERMAGLRHDSLRVGLAGGGHLTLTLEAP